MIQYRCVCDQTLQADDAQAGQQVRCPSCGQITTVPGRGEAIRTEPADDSTRQRRPRGESAGSGGGGAGFPIVLAIAGVACLMLFVCGGLVVALLLPAVQKVREAAARMQEQNNLKQMGLAMHIYNTSFNQFPRQAIEKDGKPLLSWRVALLPFLEQENLYRQFRLDEPWDSPHNIALVRSMPKVYTRPGEEPDGKGMTYYQAVVGRGMLFDPKFVDRNGKLAGRMIADIKDGTSNTVLFVVAKDPVIWTKPQDIDGDDPAPLVPRFDSRFSGGFNVALADGSVRHVRAASEATIRAALSASDGDPLGPDW